MSARFPDIAIVRCGFLVLCLLLAPVHGVRAEQVLDLVLFGDWGAPLTQIDEDTGRPTTRKFDRQVRVAKALKRWIASTDRRPDAVILLGDNFYGQLDGIDDERWDTTFSRMYPRASFPMPFYFVLGNHDFEDGSRKNWLHQLDFARKGHDDRWRFPEASPGATWGRLDLPAERPLLSLMLLNNCSDWVRRMSRPGKGPRLMAPWSEQTRWLNQQVSRPRAAPWLAAASHYPLASHGMHWLDDGPRPTDPRDRRLWHNDSDPWISTRRDLFPPMARAGARFWFGGHDHNLNHLIDPRFGTMDVLISGAGGGDNPYGRHPKAPRSEFFVRAPGWLHMRFTPTRAVGTFWHAAKDGPGREPGPYVSAGRFERLLH